MARAQRERGVLLDDEDGEALLARSAAPRISKISRTIIGARPSDGSSSISSRGRAISARPSASICCSPPESVPARWPLALGEPGERGRALARGRPRAPLAADVRAERRFSRDRQLADDPAAFGHVRDSRAARSPRAPPRDRAAVEHDLARLAHGVRDRPQRGRLAGAVRAEHRDHLAPPAPTSETPCSACTGAVARVDALELEQRHYSPRRRCRGTPRSPPGRAAPPAACPAAIFRPKSSTCTRSETPITRFMWCSTSRTVRSKSAAHLD